MRRGSRCSGSMQAGWRLSSEGTGCLHFSSMFFRSHSTFSSMPSPGWGGGGSVCARLGLPTSCAGCVARRKQGKVGLGSSGCGDCDGAPPLGHLGPSRSAPRSAEPPRAARRALRRLGHRAREQPTTRPATRWAPPFRACRRTGDEGHGIALAAGAPRAADAVRVRLDVLGHVVVDDVRHALAGAESWKVWQC